ncbi:putative poly(beta-D-mannuronate) O-acetylase [Enhygromyxa salina]|uniref:Putative poly(Beta-D-mannuronate) O-acetylase n=1 Tax=Enhygromyxa salina TaxID=215803 RepID=A0A0C2CNS5_9BACT|nr:MBOAT family O-acyltransferase [Enhygromyxa salina]KIG12881.1 putative poly(beta-D-mannuronate) O-acetylase [Enhygromyxa salina]
MTFTTLTFLLFLAVVFAGYWSVRGRVGQNWVLLVASYVFYGWWDFRFCALILASSLVDFAIARALVRRRDGPRAAQKALVALSCTLNLGVLALFKYYGFFVDSFAAGLASLGLAPSLPTLHLVLPVGISFYTFQTLSYTIDVYRDQADARSGDASPGLASGSLLDYLTYVALFPQLVAGPIERARRLLPQLQRARSFDEDQARDGAKLMLWGFAKKIILADHLGEFVEQVYGGGIVHASGPVLAVATICFAFQIYCDFSAYSDIAIGCAKLLGLSLVRNFAYPYFSQSVDEFWRRWHISLSTWFRDYVYVPLGGSHHGPARLWLALMLTFTLSGLWHGASWTFVIWGAVNGVLVGLAARLRPASSPRLGPSDLPPPLRGFSGLRALARMLATFTVICLTWVLFRAEDLPQAMGIFSRMLTDIPRPAAWTELVHHREFLAAFGPLVVMLVTVEWLTRDREHPLGLPGWPRPLRWALYTGLCWLTIYLMPDDPGAFIYFQF